MNDGKGVSFIFRTNTVMLHRLPLKKKVAIIEDDSAIRKSFEIIINSSPRFAIVGEYESCEKAFREIRKTKPDIILMDIGLPGMSGIDGVRYVKEHHPHIEVIMVTVHEDTALVFEALKAGASGYISKSSNYLELLAGLEEIMKGGAPMSTKIARMVVEDFRMNTNSILTPRETEVLGLLANGKTYVQIGFELHVAGETIKTHMKNIYKKLNVNKKSQAIEKGYKERLI